MGDIVSNNCAGGIGADCSYTTVNDCYNSGTINSTGSSSGGIIGRGMINLIIETCYNTGEIQSGNFKGALFGGASNTFISIINCCYLNLSCDRPFGNQSIVGLYSLKYHQMCMKESFQNFDFINVWEMRDGIPFPQLRGIEFPYVTKVITSPDPIYISRNNVPGTIDITVEPLTFNPYNTYTYRVSDDESIATVNKDGTIVFHSDEQTTMTIFSPHGGFSNSYQSGGGGETSKTPVILNFSVPDKIYGDAPFAVNATSSPQANIITYTSGNSAVLSIVGNMASIHKAGTVTITAKVADDDPDYTSAAVQQTITISSASINVTAIGGSSIYGATPVNPGISTSGLKYGESPDVLTGLTNSFGITASTPAGTYTLTVEGTLANVNYQIDQRTTGTWTVSRAAILPINIIWPTASSINYGQTLSESVLSGGSAAVAGNFEFRHPDLKPNVGVSQQVVVFNPSDANYAQIDGLIYVTVNGDASQPPDSENTTLTGLLVDGQPVHLIQGQTLYQYTVSCWKQALGIVALANAGVTVTVNNETGGSYNLNLPQAGVYSVTITVSSSSGKSTTYTLEVMRPFDNVLIPRWNDVLAVINNPLNNGGYTFVNYQWYKDDVLLPGEVQGFIREIGGLSASSTYHVALTTSTGIHAPSCPYIPSSNSEPLLLKAYPNPVRNSQLIQVEINLHDSEWSNAMLVLYDMQGKIIYKAKPVHGTNTIIAPSGSGSYVLTLTVGNNPVLNEKIIVKN